MRFWTPEEKELVLLNYGKLTYRQMEELLPGRTWTAIRHQARLSKLTGNSNLGRKYSVNKQFFHIPNLLNSYWAGFIAADGCIRDTGRLAIALANLDAIHLEKLVADISYTGRVIVEEKRVALTISCKEIVDDLLTNFNITPRKSKTLQPPNINDESLVSAFITGLIDGDGSIGQKRKGNICITLYGTKAILLWVKSFFDKWTTPTNYKLSEVRKFNDGRELYYYHVCSQRAKEIGLRLLSFDVPRLERKWNKIRYDCQNHFPQKSSDAAITRGF